VPFIGLVMGDRGLISCVLCAKFDEHLTFGTLESRVVSAHGRPTLKRSVASIQFQTTETLEKSICDYWEVCQSQ
ncbi:hypothetical protein RYX36_005362, partial [Vicia faba]